MSNREYAKAQIDALPERTLTTLVKVIEFMSSQNWSFESDDEYLASIPGMTESIKEGLATPLSECVSLSEVWPDV
ncbi:MAG: hypothetical protein LBI19_00295 [Oscillospiraceae bacterium]|jgi:hypothetical protein|nr:hypothetical protein [Oscillospiraceae bacterium]